MLRRNEINIPAFGTGMFKLFLQKRHTDSLALAFVVTFFFGDQCLEQHDGSCSAMWALDALKDINQFQGCLIAI